MGRETRPKGSKKPRTDKTRIQGRSADKLLHLGAFGADIDDSANFFIVFNAIMNVSFEKGQVG
jgi:hypothetical protein